MASETEELCDQLRELAFDFDRDDADAVLLRRAINVVMRRDQRIAELEKALQAARQSLGYWAATPDGQRWWTPDGTFQDPNGTHEALALIGAALTPPPKDKP